MMDKTAKIFVAGGSGMVGSAIIRKLLEKGYGNIVSSYHKRQPPFQNIRFHKVDLTNQLQTEAFFEREKPEYVFLAAAKVGGILANNTYKADFIYENLAIALNVIHAAYKTGVRKLLNFGSSCIFPKFSAQPMKEEYLLAGGLESTNEPYAIAKIGAIKLCRYFNEQYGTNFISVMSTNLYGPNDNFDLFNGHVLPALIRKFHLGRSLREENWPAIREDLNQRPIEGISGKNSEAEILMVLKKYGISRDYVEIWGSGQVYREFLHVDDLTDACLLLMEKVDAQQMKTLSADYFVNVGTGVDLTINELAHLVKDVVGFEGDILHDLSKPDGPPRKLLDVSKMHQLGWKPRIQLKDGIKMTYEWYLNYR